MIFIATPCLETVTLQYHISMCKLAAYFVDKKISYQFAYLTDCNSMRSRAELTSAFLKSGADYMLQIDSDMQFIPEDVVKLLSHELPLVAAVYRKRQMRWDLVENAIKNNDSRYACYGDYTFVVAEENCVIKNGLLRVKYAPSGLMLVKREVIEKVVGNYPELKFNSKQFGNAWAIYDNIIGEEGTYLSTDYSFCERVTRCGYPIYVDLNLKINHVGTHVFESDPMVCVQ